MMLPIFAVPISGISVNEAIRHDSEYKQNAIEKIFKNDKFEVIDT